MRKFFALLFPITCMSTITSAQIKQGSILLGGQVSSYNSTIDYSTNQRSQKNNSSTFNIAVGKAFKENSVFGINLTYSPSSFSYSYNNYVNTKQRFYSLGVYARQYKKLVKDLYFFTELGGAYVFSTQIDTDTLGTKLSTGKGSGGQLNLTPGISYKICKKINLEVTIPNIVYVQYAITKNETISPPQNSKETRFLFSTNLTSSFINNLGIGFRLIL